MGKDTNCSKRLISLIFFNLSNHCFPLICCLKFFKMKKIFFTVSLFILSTTLLFAQRSDCGVSPYPSTFTQPDGSTLTLYALGTESIHYLETTTGYTVLKDNAGNFEYAIKGMDGNLTISGIVANDDNSVYGKTDIPKHLRYSSQQISALLQYHASLEQNQSVYNKTGANVFPPTGTHKVLVLLIEFPDLRHTVDISNFNLLFNQPSYNGTGSFNDYYKKTTFGALNVTVDVYGWYMAQNSYLKYGKTSSPNYGSYTQQLLQRAVTCADSAGVNFPQYDSDNDGYLDAVMILHAGFGAEEASNPTSGNYIWSFRSSWGSSPTYQGKKVYAYDMFPERRFYTNGAMVGIGVMTHEFGHILDLPDLYATMYNGTGGGPEGVGDYANMSGGPWLNNERTPCMHDAFSKMLLNWMTPTLISTTGKYTIPKSTVDSNFAYRINTPNSSEYFLIENRQLKGQDLYLPCKGLAIWHVNTTLAGRLSTLPNNANNDTSNEGLGILQADGLRDLELGNNRGDNGDLFPGSTNNHIATPYSNPNTNLYSKVGGVKQPSGIYITKITQNPDSSMSFNLGPIPTAYYKTSTTVGCTPFTVNFTNYSIFAKTYQWNFGDGNTSGSTNIAHTFNAPGNYNVRLIATDSSGTITDTMIQTINVYAKPIAGISYTRSGSDIIFKNNSTGATSYFWKFNNTFTSTQKDLGKLNANQIGHIGLDTFMLVVSNGGGCYDTTQIVVNFWAVGINQLSNNTINASIYPNPVEDNSILSFSTTNSGLVNVEIFNVIGEKVVSLESSVLQAGIHEYKISKNMFTSSGVYFVKINSENGNGFIRIMNK